MSFSFVIRFFFLCFWTKRRTTVSSVVVVPTSVKWWWVATKDKDPTTNNSSTTCLSFLLVEKQNGKKPSSSSSYLPGTILLLVREKSYTSSKKVSVLLLQPSIFSFKKNKTRNKVTSDQPTTRQIIFGVTSGSMMDDGGDDGWEPEKYVKSSKIRHCFVDGARQAGKLPGEGSRHELQINL